LTLYVQNLYWNKSQIFIFYVIAMVVYSFSQINLYEQCPRKYQYRYLDQLERAFETSPDLILGTSVHGALEWLYQQVNIFNIPIKADLLGKFHELWQNTRADTGENLVYKGDQHEDNYLRRGEQYLERYYETYAPFKDSKIIATELMMNFDLQKKENWWEQKFRWIIDRLDKEGESFVINDYKTNKQLPPEEKEEYREQLTLYALGVQQKYGKYFQKLKARLHYLHFELTDEWEITDELLQPIIEKYREAINAIEKARFDYNMGITTAFPTKQNAYCKYCEYQQLCPLWKHLNYADEAINWGELGEQTIKKLVDQYAKLTRESTELNKEKENLKEILVAYAEKGGFEQLFGEESKIWISKSDSYSAKDKDELKKFLAEQGLLEDAIEIPYYKLNTLVKNQKLTPEQIQMYLTKKDSRRITPSKKKE